MTFPQQLPTVPKPQLIMDFINSLGWDAVQEVGYPLFPGPEILSSPDRAVFITPTAGPGWVTEEAALDCWGFQARVRGPADDPLGPSLAMQRLDILILNASLPALVDGIQISLVTRSGGTPVPMPPDPQDRRFEYTCTYLITTGGE